MATESFEVVRAISPEGKGERYFVVIRNMSKETVRALIALMIHDQHPEKDFGECAGIVDEKLEQIHGAPAYRLSTKAEERTAQGLATALAETYQECRDEIAYILEHGRFRPTLIDVAHRLMDDIDAWLKEIGLGSKSWMEPFAAHEQVVLALAINLSDRALTSVLHQLSIIGNEEGDVAMDARNVHGKLSAIIERKN